MEAWKFFIRQQEVIEEHDRGQGQSREIGNSLSELCLQMKDMKNPGQKTQNPHPRRKEVLLLCQALYNLCSQCSHLHLYIQMPLSSRSLFIDHKMPSLSLMLRISNLCNLPPPQPFLYRQAFKVIASVLKLMLLCTLHF